MPGASHEALAASSGHKAHVWQPFSKESDLNHFSVESEGKIYCVQWNQNNKVIVSGGQSGVVTLNYNKDGALMGTLPKDTPTSEDRLSAISSIAFSRGSKLLAAGCMDSSVRVWDLKQQACKYFLESHKAAVTYVTFSTDDQFLASACLTGEIHMHTVRQTSQAAVLRTPGNRAKRSLHFTSLEPLLASGAEDGSLYVWDTTTYTLLDSYLQTHSTTVSRVCFSPGSPNILISAGLDRSIVLTDRRLDAAIANVPCPSPLTALDCKDDGNCITVGNTHGKVQLFDPRKLQTPLMELSCPGGEPVSCLHWQQAVTSSSKSAKKPVVPAASNTPAAPRSVLRGQDLLSAASPATPMVPNARHMEGATTSPEKPEQKPQRTASIASDHSQPSSETSYRSTVPGALSDHGDPLGPRYPHLRARPDPTGEAAPAQNGGLRSSDWQDPQNPLFPPHDAQPLGRHPSEGAARLAQAAHPFQGGLVGSSAPSREPNSHHEPPMKASTSSRLGGGSKPDVSRADRHVPLAESGRQLSSNPGFDPDTDPPSQDEAADTQQAASHAAVFGDRLRRMMGVQTEEAEPALTGNGRLERLGPGKSALEQPAAQIREPSGSQMADEIKAAISADIKTLHFEMIRQFHIQQAEVTELVEKLAYQQQQIAEDMAQLRLHVQQLLLRQ